ncbi:MAG: tRNA lysidine(34) synthetase TilS [Rubricoccaceae bacterium]|nr:tRNA lysidine(34) synthetase TilS [Rubricoccaceae bacterium]
MALPDLRDLHARFGLSPGAPIVVGASGGLDSTVLLRLLHEAGAEVVAAHVNYGLRGADAEADEAFVRALAGTLGVAFDARRVALDKGGNRQAAARDARYAFFGEVAARHGAEAVAVGHTQDDQAETVLLHLFRGTGVRGLAGMPPARPLTPGSSVRLLRPLLDVPRADLDALARARGWAWREDASNASGRYRRNRLRTEVLPEIRAVFGPGVSGRIAATAERVRALLDAQPAAGPRLDLDALRAMEPARRHARYLDGLRAVAPEAPRRTTVAELDRLLDAQPGARVVWPGVVVWRDRAALVFEPAPAPPAPEDGAWPVTPGVPIVTPQGTFLAAWLEAVPATWPDSPNEEVVDASAFAGPLVLRRWRAGDRFRPLGLDGTVLVSDLLTDRKVEPSRRAEPLVLCAGDAIVWVVGHRLAEAARVRPETRHAVRLTWQLTRGD